MRRTCAALLAVVASLATAAGVFAATPSLQDGSAGPKGPAAAPSRLSAPRVGGPDTPQEQLAMAAYANAPQNAPYLGWKTGAYRNAVFQKAELRGLQSSVPGATGTWRQLGQAPLYNDSKNPEYNQCVCGNLDALGYPQLSGRVTALANDPARVGRYFLATGGGGVWESTDSAASWHSIGDLLPTQIVGGLAYSSANGGTVVAGTGDNATGTFGQSGLGIAYTTDDGASWKSATGVPDDILTYKIAVDPTNPLVIYAATSKGLYRSIDGGQSYVNTVLPTTCTNTSSRACFFANFVTDVVVRPADSNGANGGKVMAVVGWRLGQNKDPDGTTVQAPQNGIYTSTTGAPGTFTFINPGGTPGNGFSPVANTGRTSLAIAAGPTQNHDVVYAMVQDPVKMQNCGTVENVDTPVCNSKLATAYASYLNGLYATTNFGQTWTQVLLPDSLKLPTTGTSLFGLPGYAPGVQSWYNTWVAVDPTTQDGSGVPTRVLFGLEEMWENDNHQVGLTGPSTFHTISRYWNACAGTIAGVNCTATPTQASLPGGTTMHPDHHAAIFVPDITGGGLTLLAGTDGGAWTQHIASGGDFNNDNWVPHQRGLLTEETYNAVQAKDGKVVAGLQDNGLMQISTNGRQDMIFGGDAFLSFFDPNNTKNIVEEYVTGIVNITADGGQNWCNMDPALTTPNGEAPLQIDHSDAKHLIIAGQDVEEVELSTYDQTPCDPTGNQAVTPSPWTKVFDLGTSASGAVNRGTASDLNAENAYMAFCSNCTPLTGATNSAFPFGNGLATNVGGDKPAKKVSPDGWHIATATGLPNRLITSVRMDPANPRTVYVTLGGYNYRWLPVGATGDSIARVGSGHVYKSVDAGKTFTDISGNLPDITADWSVIHNGQLIVATDVGVFISTDVSGGTYAPLGSGLPNVRVRSVELSAQNPDRIIAGTASRGVWAMEVSAATTPAPSPSPAMVSLPKTTAGPRGAVPWWPMLVVVPVTLLALGRRRLRAGGRSVRG